MDDHRYLRFLEWVFYNKINFTEQEIFNDVSDLNNLVKKIRKHSIIFYNIQRLV